MTKTKVVQSLRTGTNMKKYEQITRTPEYRKLKVGADPRKIGIWTAVASEDTDKDYDYYSKAWHRQYGARVTISNRRVTFTSNKGVVRVARLDSWQGNWQLKALLLAGIVKPKRKLMSVRLNPAFDVELIGARLGHRFYLRSLKGEPCDYCVVSPAGTTYHGSTIDYCLRGLRQKQVQVERRKVAVIDWKFLRKLGFCKEGIREFCRAFGFEPTDAATPQEVYDRVRAHPEAAEPYLAELKTVAKVVGFSVPEWS